MQRLGLVKVSGADILIALAGHGIPVMLGVVGVYTQGGYTEVVSTARYAHKVMTVLHGLWR